MPSATLSSDLGADLLRALDPVRFAEDLTGWSLDPWQQDVLSRSDADRMALCCSRQSGKSSIASLVALHQSVYTPGSLVLLLSPSLRQSSELFQTLHGFYNAIADDFPARRESALRLELRNGSRIISLPGQENTVRGFSGVGLLIIDEASRVPDDLYHGVSPMLAVSGGRMILLSTPWGRRGFFYSVFDGDNDFHKVKATAEDCPRISADFLRRERAQMPNWTFQQEYMCSFEENTASVFEWSVIQEASKGKVEQWRL